jgi:serine/threonine protein kinase
MLAGNALTELPEAMQNCRALELLRLSANQFNVFPDWLFDLPHLAWLALSGNPCTPIQEQNAQKNKINFQDLAIEVLLGEGASGFIYKVRHTLTQELYALKIFKGHVTSDGYADDERKISLQVGAHENLVEVVAELHNHPEGKKGLLCKLIPSDYKNLGQPPSFETCTRDVFSTSFTLTKSEVDQMIVQMRNAAAHLHEQGIMHGDIYAHNVLYNHEGHILLGDMGAATVFKNMNLPVHQLLKIEGRALQMFEEDLRQLVR